jgi:hypothetical protein
MRGTHDAAPSLAVDADGNGRPVRPPMRRADVAAPDAPGDPLDGVLASQKRVS